MSNTQFSKSSIENIAEERGFNPLIIEKVLHLISLLNAMNADPILHGKLALKGGTALNLFLLDLPRLSVDIDMNYIASVERDRMLNDRPLIEQACQSLFRNMGFTIKRSPSEHAGGKWRLSYINYRGEKSNIEVDINFIHRSPLWPVVYVDSVKLGDNQALAIPLSNTNEIIAGKLSALIERSKPRDVYDTAKIFEMIQLDSAQMRLAFVVYGGMSSTDWRTISLDSIRVHAHEFENQLLPYLITKEVQQVHSVESYIQILKEKCIKGLEMVYPFTESELRFLDALWDEGKIEPAFITQDNEMQMKIRSNPGLQWTVLKVKKYKNLK